MDMIITLSPLYPFLFFAQPLKYNDVLQDLSLSFSLCLAIFLQKARFISPVVQVGRLIGFLFYVELSVDSASDSEKRNGEVRGDGPPGRKGDGRRTPGGGMNAGVSGWDKHTLLLREEKSERERKSEK